MCLYPTQQDTREFYRSIHLKVGGLKNREEARWREYERGCLQSCSLTTAVEHKASENLASAKKAAHRLQPLDHSRAQGHSSRAYEIYNKIEAHIRPQLPLPPEWSLCLRGSQTQVKILSSQWWQVMTMALTEGGQQPPQRCKKQEWRHRITLLTETVEAGKCYSQIWLSRVISGKSNEKFDSAVCQKTKAKNLISNLSFNIEWTIREIIHQITWKTKTTLHHKKKMTVLQKRTLKSQNTVI